MCNRTCKNVIKSRWVKILESGGRHPFRVPSHISWFQFLISKLKLILKLKEKKKHRQWPFWMKSGSKNNILWLLSEDMAFAFKFNSITGKCLSCLLMTGPWPVFWFTVHCPRFSPLIVSFLSHSLASLPTLLRPVSQFSCFISEVQLSSIHPFHCLFGLCPVSLFKSLTSLPTVYHLIFTVVYFYLPFNTFLPHLPSFHSRHYILPSLKVLKLIFTIKSFKLTYE